MIKNILKINNIVIVTLSDGTTYKSDKCDDTLYNKILQIKESDEMVVEQLNQLFYPGIYKKQAVYDNVLKSQTLTFKDGSVYMPEISNLTLPQMLVEKILVAEQTNDISALTAYKNFWTLLSLNPNSNVRDNLFWFLNRWGMSICKSGLFVAYRNVHLKNDGVKYNKELTEIISKTYFNFKHSNIVRPKRMNVFFDIYTKKYIVTNNQSEVKNTYVKIGNLEELYNNIIFCDSNAGTVYTDDRTHSFKIRLGHIVSMPRKDCDEDSERSCSSGLHVGAKGWLKNNYCGNIGLKVLVNPADCCAAPKIDQYGKLRTCAYYPIQVVDFDNNGDVKDETVPDGFEVDFINKISYTGEINNVDNDNYKLDIPENITKKNVENVYKSLKETASQINRRV